MRSFTAIVAFRRAAVAGLVVAGVFLAAGFYSGVAAAFPPVLWQTTGTGGAAGHMAQARGSAADPSTGHVFVSDQTNRRISEFDAWGVFIKAWGWDVADTGDPGDTAPMNQFEICTTACKPGIQGSGGGQFDVPSGVAVDSASNVYVFEAGNSRVQKFSPAGQFLRAWGADVSATGPNQAGTPEVQKLTVKATSGTFTLTFDGQLTSAIPFDADATVVQSALQALTTTFGAASVSGGPGDETGSNPYAITLSGYDAPQISIDSANLGVPVGTVLTCSSSTAATTTNFQWLSDGAPATGPGASSSSYTTVAADAGKPVQCQVTKLNANAGSTQVSNPRVLVANVPATPPPLAPVAAIASPTGTAAAGQNLTCNPNAASWIGVTLPFVYQWYRNGIPLAGNGANTSVYSVQAADVATAAVFQCGVTGSNGSGSVTKISQNKATAPAPSPAAPPSNTTSPNVSAPSPLVSSVTTITPGAAAPEICIPASGNVCKGGVQGAANGQFGAVQGLSTEIAVTPDNRLYVGDVGRIQRFDTDGVYQGQVTVPGEAVQHLAVDSTGHLYIAYRSSGNISKSDVIKVAPVDGPIGPTLAVCTAANPRALAVAPNDDVYVFDQAVAQIKRFDPSCSLVDFSPQPTDLSPLSTGLSANDCGTSEPSVYHSNNSLSFVRAYSFPPEAAACGDPPEVEPDITAQYAISVDADSAQLKADIDPEYWDDTSYHVEYGTVDCSLSACNDRRPLAGEIQLNSGVVSAPVTTSTVFIDGLEAGTTYYYRFVAQSGGGGPVKGVGGTELIDGKVGTFTTAPSSVEPNLCPNQEFRIGSSAHLPHCRAYEMVSPVDKSGGDVETIPSPQLGPAVPESYDQSSADGETLTYSSQRAFCNISSAPWSSQYLAHREEGGWTCQGISPPRETVPGLGRQELVSQFKAFSEDLSQGWFIHDGDGLEVGCTPQNSFNLFRVDIEVESYEELNCEPIRPEVHGVKPLELQGISADGCYAVFRSKAKLTTDANEIDTSKKDQTFQLYQASCKGPLRHIGKLPGGGNCMSSSTVGSSGPPGEDGRRNLVWHAFSANAHRLYWSCGKDLYLRFDPDLDLVGDEEVVLVSSGDTGFRAASAFDGSSALFVVGDNLNVYNAVSHVASTLAGGIVGGALLGASDDGMRAYFASTQNLTGVQENSEGKAAIAGKPNLYFYDGSSGSPELSFVGTLANPDLAVDELALAPLMNAPSWRTSRVSPDGLYAAFTSSAPLTDYDNTDVNNGKAATEVFLYDAAANAGAGELDCISCNPSGARPAGQSLGTAASFSELWGAAWIPGWMGQLYPTRALSNDGGRLFFNSYDALSLHDTNGKKDVYEWSQAVDKEECDELGAEQFVAKARGCISLISSGQSPTDSEFVDADQDGDNVFVRTSESLLPQDPGSVDIYVARVNGGLEPPLSPRPGCQGEACQNPSAPPEFPDAGSAGYVGPGDPIPSGSGSTPAKISKARPGKNGSGKVKARPRGCKKRSARPSARRDKGRCPGKRQRQANGNRGAGR